MIYNKLFQDLSGMDLEFFLKINHFYKDIESVGDAINFINLTEFSPRYYDLFGISEKEFQNNGFRMETFKECQSEFGIRALYPIIYNKLIKNLDDYKLTRYNLNKEKLEKLDKISIDLTLFGITNKLN